MNHLYWLSQIQPKHRSVVGEKVSYLGQLLQLGLPIIPGFVVLPQAFRQCLDTINWLEPLFADLSSSSLRLNIYNPHQLRAIAQCIRQELCTATLPPSLLAELTTALEQLNCQTVILRPAITVSEPYLDRVADFRSSSLFTIQVCPAEPTALVSHLKRLWVDLFSAKSLFYWQRLGIYLQHIHLSVLVQPIQSAQVSGVVDVGPDRWQVQATPGLGVAILWGEVTPDLYHLEPSTEHLQSYQPGQQLLAYQVPTDASTTRKTSFHDLTGLQVEWFTAGQSGSRLSDAQLTKVSHLTQQVLTVLSPPLQLEWTLTQQGQLYLTQVTRTSIPAVPRMSVAGPASEATELWVRGLPASRGQAIGRAYVVHQTNHLPDLPEQAVLVAPTIPLDWIPHLKQVAAIVMEQGSLTSHCAIVARELGIPAVVGAGAATQNIPAHAWICVDGDRGLVYPSDASTTIAPFSPNQLSHPKPTIKTQLLVNLSQPDAIPQKAQLPVHGIGLIRSELLAGSLGMNHSPLQWLQDGRAMEWRDRLTDALIQFAAGFFPRPVYYRSLDWRSSEWQPPQTGQNPSTLGRRGTFQYLLEPQLFAVELAALAQAQQAGYSNLHLILPFVRTVEEFRACRQQVEAAGLPKVPTFQLWIMAEVPSVLFLLPDYVAAGVQGIAIGTNDLTQLLLGVDRDSPDFAGYDERHPAVQRAIAQLIQQAKSLGIPCSLCGQAPVTHPELIATLVRWGITALSVEADAIELTYWAIVQAERQLEMNTSRDEHVPPCGAM